MKLKPNVRKNTGLRKLARSVEKKLKPLMLRGLWFILRAPHATTLERVGNIRSILLIRPNYRLGNALISTPLIELFRRRYPDARLDLLVTDATESIFRNFPVDRTYVMTRKAILRPWRALSLLRALRRERYCLAVQISGGSFTGGIFARLVGARYSLGAARSGLQLYDIEVAGETGHAYDSCKPFADLLGLPVRDRPRFVVSAEESSDAVEELRGLLRREETAHVALFVGGHLDKRSPVSFWADTIEHLERAAVPYVVYVGPEEAELAAILARRVSDDGGGSVCRPRPLRQFGAMLQLAAVLVTPDSGPMHLAAAVDTPVVAVLRQKLSEKYAPRGARDLALWAPSALQVFEHAVSYLEPSSQERAVRASPPIMTG